MIVSQPLNFSPHSSEFFQELLKGVLVQVDLLIPQLLAPNPENRLSASEIKALPFFRATDWEKVATRENTPLFRLVMDLTKMTYLEGEK